MPTYQDTFLALIALATIAQGRLLAFFCFVSVADLMGSLLHLQYSWARDTPIRARLSVQ